LSDPENYTHEKVLELKEKFSVKMLSSVVDRFILYKDIDLGLSTSKSTFWKFVWFFISLSKKYIHSDEQKLFHTNVNYLKYLF